MSIRKLSHCIGAASPRFAKEPENTATIATMLRRSRVALGFPPLTRPAGPSIKRVCFSSAKAAGPCGGATVMIPKCRLCDDASWVLEQPRTEGFTRACPSRALHQGTSSVPKSLRSSLSAGPPPSREKGTWRGGLCMGPRPLSPARYPWTTRPTKAAKCATCGDTFWVCEGRDGSASPFLRHVLPVEPQAFIAASGPANLTGQKVMWLVPPLAQR